MLVFYKEQNSTRLNKIILERAKRNWNRLFSPWNSQQGSLAVLVLFVGRRYYLRPIIP